jgi:LCP family protein required for cell wall assembly
MQNPETGVRSLVRMRQEPQQRPEAEPQPEYRLYRSRPKLLGGSGADQLDKLRARAPKRRNGTGGGGRAPRAPRGFSFGRVARWILLAVAAWIGLSLVAFLVSAQIEQGKVDDDVSALLGGAGYPLWSPNNVLVLGSDQRSAGTAEPGSTTSGPSRSDSIMLLRVGGGNNQRLSIARDTLVDIPGSGVQKINAAYAIGGAALAIRTVEQYTGIDVNHVIEVSFEDFPKLIDAMGGISYKGGCVVGKVNGGYANGGVTVRVPAGKKTHLNGDQALALARTRKNLCNPRENDLSRARRQQKIISSMKSRALSPAGFIRMPMIAWQMPKTFRSDMSGPTMLGLFAAMSVGSSETRVLGTPSGVVPPELKQRRVEQFLDG